MVKGYILSTKNADLRFCSSRHACGEVVLIKVNSQLKETYRLVNLMYSLVSYKEDQNA